MAIGFAQHADSHAHFPIDSHASCVAQATRKKVSFATWVQFELAVGGLLHNSYVNLPEGTTPFLNDDFDGRIGTRGSGRCRGAGVPSVWARTSNFSRRRGFTIKGA